MTEKEFKHRTKQLALRIVRVVQALPKDDVARTIGKQLLRSGTSVGANYRAACRGKSVADVIHKLSIAEEEADERLFWVELLVEAEIIPAARLKELMKEMDEVLAMIVSSIKTLRSQTNHKTTAVSHNNHPKSKIQNHYAKIYFSVRSRHDVFPRHSL